MKNLEKKKMKKEKRKDDRDMPGKKKGRC